MAVLLGGTMQRQLLNAARARVLLYIGGSAQSGLLFDKFKWDAMQPLEKGCPPPPHSMVPRVLQSVQGNTSFQPSNMIPVLTIT